MGFLIRSENSLNQHIKIKHFEFWKKLKNSNKKIFGMNDLAERVGLGHCAGNERVEAEYEESG